MVAVLPPDIELFYCTWLREVLPTVGSANVTVSDQEPETLTFPLTSPLVVVRDDGGVQNSPLTYARTITLTVLGGTRRDAYETLALARTIYAIATSTQAITANGSPLVTIFENESQPPMRIADEADVTRASMAIELVAQGTDFHEHLEPATD